MMKILKKIFLALGMNLLAVLGVICNIWEGVKKLAVYTIHLVGLVLVKYVGFASVILVIFGLVGPGTDSWGLRIAFVAVAVLLALFFRGIGDTLTKLIAMIPEYIAGIIDLSDITGAIANKIYDLTMKYSLCGRHPVLDVLLQAPRYVIAFLWSMMRIVGKTVLFLLFPVFGIGAGCGSYLLWARVFAVEDFVSEKYLAIALSLVAVGVGVYFAYLFRKVALFCAAESDYGLYDALKAGIVHSRRCKKEQAKQSYRQEYTDRNERQTQETSKTNEYDRVFAGCSSPREAKQQYWELTKKLHPDVSLLSQEESAEKMTQLNLAYERYKKSVGGN